MDVCTEYCAIFQGKKNLLFWVTSAIKGKLFCYGALQRSGLLTVRKALFRDQKVPFRNLTNLLRDLTAEIELLVAEKRRLEYGIQVMQVFGDFKNYWSFSRNVRQGARDSTSVLIQF